MRTAKEIKALGEAVWGSQSGLLSESELAKLMSLISDETWPGDNILEVGHFYGLSTCGIMEALHELDHPNIWFSTVDNHRADGSVGESDAQAFFHNVATYMAPAPRTEFEICVQDSQELTTPLLYDIVFYDGDHREEQERFTKLVVESPQVRLFIFDDADYEVPARCKELLLDNGWRDESPKLYRSALDKRDPETMTLAVFRRAS